MIFGGLGQIDVGSNSLDLESCFVGLVKCAQIRYWLGAAVNA